MGKLENFPIIVAAANRRRSDAAAEMPPHIEFLERDRVGYFQLKASVSLSVSQS